MAPHPQNKPLSSLRTLNCLLIQRPLHSPWLNVRGAGDSFPVSRFPFPDILICPLLCQIFNISTTIHLPL